jgi:putative hemolysin
MFTVARVPKTGDRFECAGYHFEIMDMDGNRVDRVLVTRLDSARGRGSPRPDL